MLPLKTHCLLLESVKCDNITNSRISFKSISITHAWSPSRMSWAINNGSSLSRDQFSKAFPPVVSLELKVIDGDDLWLVSSIRKCIRKLPQILKTKWQTGIIPSKKSFRMSGWRPSTAWKCVFVQWTVANLTHFCTEKQWQYIANHIHQHTSVNWK